MLNRGALMIIGFDSDPIYLSALIKDDIKSWQPVSENTEAVDHIFRYAFELVVNRDRQYFV